MRWYQHEQVLGVSHLGGLPTQADNEVHGLRLGLTLWVPSGWRSARNCAGRGNRSVVLERMISRSATGQGVDGVGSLRRDPRRMMNLPGECQLG